MFKMNTKQTENRKKNKYFKTSIDIFIRIYYSKFKYMGMFP